ncbi:hypothetical protein [Pseudomonas serbica]|uniref:hypothetical protein n=1 Tax=Pseudomonas serbica TaxID=2965074 RepID=UPI00237ADE65|nr:hypothetical protein [Pseudomonas serbica]
MTTSASIPSKLPRQLVTEYYQHFNSLKAAVLTPEGDHFDPNVYRQSVADPLEMLRGCTLEMALSGHQDCFARLGIHSAELIVALTPISSNEALAIALDEVSKAFPVSSDFLLALRTSPLKAVLPERLPVGLIKQAVRGHDKPFEMLDNYLSKAVDEDVLPILLTGIDAVLPLESHEDLLGMGRLFNNLKRLLKTRSNIPDAIEWFGANQTALFPIIADVLEEAKRLHDDVTSTAKDKGVLLYFAFPPEFLCGLQASINHPVITDLASLALEHPRGYMAYAYLDSMGFAQTKEWHAQAQADANWSKLAKLHEYAMVTPGLELDLSHFDELGGVVSMHAARLYTELLAETPALSDDAKRKQALIFDALVRHCADQDFGDRIRALIINGNIPKELFKKHLNLLGDRFHQDLGL